MLTVEAELSKRLIAERHRRGNGRYPISMEKAAAEIGIGKDIVARIEKGMPCRLPAFRAVCKWLGASADEVLGLSGGKKQ